MDTEAMDSCLTVDRISNLPCGVTNEILKYLPLGEVVKTSILSRGWRYKWRTIPRLVFDRNFKMKLLGKHTFDSVIYQVLLLHKGPIVKFTLESDDGGDSFCSAVDKWLYFLSDHRTEELTLDFSFSGNSRVMSHHLFSFDHLKHLSLINCSLKPPSAFKGFGKLVTLDLKNVCLIESGGHTKLISKCPMLEHLNLYHVDLLEFADLEMDAPNLKSFAFLGKCPSLCFKNTSFLEKVSIIFYRIPSPGKSLCSGINLIEYFGQLSSIKYFKLNLDFLQFLSTGVVPPKLPNDLSHLSDLQCCINFAAMAQVHCALCLMRSSPKLQSIAISSMTTRYIDMKPSTEFLKKQQKLKLALKFNLRDLTLGHLKNVKIDGFSGSIPEMEFVKLILSGATALIKLELDLGNHLKDATKEGYLMFKELAEFPRASSKAKIIT